MNSAPRCKEEYAISVKAIMPSPKILPSLDHKVHGIPVNEFHGKPAIRLDIGA